MRTNRGRATSRRPLSTKMNFKKKLLIQTAVSILIIVIIFSIKSINTSYTNSASEKIKNTLYYTVDYETTVRNIMNYMKSIPQMWNKDAKDTDNNDTKNEKTNEPKSAPTDNTL